MDKPKEKTLAQRFCAALTQSEKNSSDFALFWLSESPLIPVIIRGLFASWLLSCFVTNYCLDYIIHYACLCSDYVAKDPEFAMEKGCNGTQVELLNTNDCRLPYVAFFTHWTEVLSNLGAIFTLVR